MTPFRGISTTIVVAMLLATPASAQRTAESVAVDALMAMDARVFRVGGAVARGGVAHCPNIPSAGVLLAAATQYSGRHAVAAAARLGSATLPVVVDVLAPGPVAVGDQVVAIGGVAVPAAAGGGDFARSRAIADALERGSAGGTLTLTIRRGGAVRDVTLPAAPSCAARFDVVPEAAVNASANGREVRVSTALLDVVDDAGLAAVIAHELAHHILGHPAVVRGVRRGILPGFGRGGAAMRSTELQADRLSLHLLAGGGWAPRGAIDFWRGFLARHGPGMFSDRTHPGTRERIAAMEAEAGRIAAGAGPAPDIAYPVARNQRSAP